MDCRLGSIRICQLPQSTLHAKYIVLLAPPLSQIRQLPDSLRDLHLGQTLKMRGMISSRAETHGIRKDKVRGEETSEAYMKASPYHSIGLSFALSLNPQIAKLPE